MNKRDELADKYAARDGLICPTKFYSFCDGYDAGQTSPEVKALIDTLADIRSECSSGPRSSIDTRWILDRADHAISKYDRATSGKASE